MNEETFTRNSFPDIYISLHIYTQISSVHSHCGNNEAIFLHYYKKLTVIKTFYYKILNRASRKQSPYYQTY
jgi:hypothetical protein